MGPQKPKVWRENSQKRGLANKLVQATAEKNNCTKFEKKTGNISISRD